MTKEIDKEMSEQLLRSLGWKMEGFNHSTPFTSHVFYIRDFRYKHQQLFTVAKDDFYSPNIIDNSPIGDYVNFIGQVMKKIAKKKSLTEMDKRGIAPVLINYIKNTQSFKQWRDISEPDERLHCVLNGVLAQSRSFRGESSKWFLLFSLLQRL
ncbi:TPA: hypothetical protein J7103_002585 [Escherichia coli]|nr:hypothetical protein [Escherichia coli]